VLHTYPSKVFLNKWKEASKFIIKKEGKLSCPLCLLAVKQIYNVIKDNKTEVLICFLSCNDYICLYNLFDEILMLQAYIGAELDKVCNLLSHILTDKCIDFVKSYSKKLAEMLADLSPLKVCIHLHLCDGTKDPGPKSNNIAKKNGEICELFPEVHI